MNVEDETHGDPVGEGGSGEGAGAVEGDREETAAEYWVRILLDELARRERDSSGD